MPTQQPPDEKSPSPRFPRTPRTEGLVFVLAIVGILTIMGGLALIGQGLELVGIPAMMSGACTCWLGCAWWRKMPPAVETDSQYENRQG